MIKLKSGKTIEYNEDYDVFFQTLMKEIIAESIATADVKFNSEKNKEEDINKLVFKEMMDNSIFITHQLFEIATHNQQLVKFLVTGFLFNNLALSLPNLTDKLGGSFLKNNSGTTIH